MPSTKLASPKSIPNAAVKIHFLLYDFYHADSFVRSFAAPASKSFLSTYFGFLMFELIEMLFVLSIAITLQTFFSKSNTKKGFLGVARGGRGGGDAWNLFEVKTVQFKEPKLLPKS